ncbi:N-acetyltransferase YodP [compost metagenome]
MKKIGIKTLYSVVRAKSFDANILFSKIGFKFSGTLINNTNISGRIESMNVWYKEI